MSSVLAHHLDATLTPLLDPKMGSDPVWVPEELEARLFPDLPEDAPTQRLFALLDAGKLPFLAERLAQSGLRHQCLYEFDDFNDEASDVAPWLVELTPESNLLRHFFAFDPEAEDPFHLLALGAGILLRTHSDITQLRAHLRHYSVLPDESGARMVLRMAEPGALDAVLSASRAEECAAFFAQVLEVTYLLASLEDNKWDAISVSYAGPVQDTRARPVLDRVRRDSLRSMHNTIRARTLARATGGGSRGPAIAHADLPPHLHDRV